MGKASNNLYQKNPTQKPENPTNRGEKKHCCAVLSALEVGHPSLPIPPGGGVDERGGVLP